jgi:virginiamycin B lyase
VGINKFLLDLLIFLIAKSMMMNEINVKPGLLCLILTVSVSFIFVGFQLSDKNSLAASDQFSQLQNNSKTQAILQFQSQFCGLNSAPHSNSFITEYLLPQKCEMPLGILVRNESVWYVSTKLGLLGKFNTNDNSSKEFTIPVWNSRSKPTDISQTWDVKMDPKGNIWFTDEKQNGIWRYEPDNNRFSFFPIPERPTGFGTTYPISIIFDNDDQIYFVGIRSKSLWFGNVSDLKNNSSEGISNISLPLSSFKGIDPDLVSTGSIEIDRDRNILWISMLAFGVKGQLFKFDLTTKTFTTFNLPVHLDSPVGIAIDEKGNPWITDHGTSIFFMVNSTNGRITEFSTSPLSRISQNIQKEYAYTLPYWIKIDTNGILWFNEHIGNKIARFNSTDGTLVEYWIPTQNNLWAPCTPNDSSCGISNTLQLSIGKNNQLWFSEWTENKIGMLNGSKPLSFVVDTSSKELNMKKGETTEIPLIISATDPVNLRMIASSTFTSTGNFGNSSISFSQDSFSMNSDETKNVTFLVTPSNDLDNGEYTLMIGAENDEVSYLNSIKVHLS